MKETNVYQEKIKSREKLLDFLAQGTQYWTQSFTSRMGEPCSPQWITRGLDKVYIEKMSFEGRSSIYSWGKEVEKYVDISRIEKDIENLISKEWDLLEKKVEKEIEENGSEYQDEELKTLRSLLNSIRFSKTDTKYRYIPSSLRNDFVIGSFRLPDYILEMVPYYRMIKRNGERAR